MAKIKTPEELAIIEQLNILKMDNYYLKNTINKGRGVFANRDFQIGEIVEVSPVIVFDYQTSITTSEVKLFINNEPTLVKKEIYKDNLPNEINNIIFNWSSLIRNGKKESCIALGYGSLFNSANPSNMKYIADEKNMLLNFIAIRHIKKHEELTINYSGINGDNLSEGNCWFDHRNIEFKE